MQKFLKFLRYILYLLKYVKTYDFVKSFTYVVPKRVNSNITSRVDTCISSTRVSRILVQFPLYSPSFSNCPPLSIDTSHATFHDTFVPLHTLTYVVRFLIFCAKLAYTRVEWIALQRPCKNLRFPRTVSSLYKSYKDPTSWIPFEKNDLILSRKDF